MIKFFRHIRQNLLSEKQTSKYFKYAIGEIVLVVIGILIALQINNWNEKRKNENKITIVLKEIQKDLEEDIVKSKALFTYYNKRDSIIQLALDNKLTRENYLSANNYEFIYVAMNAFHLKIHDNGYKKLTDNIDNIPEKYQELISPLNEIYIYNKYEIDKFDIRIDKVTDRLIDKLADSKPWYYSLNKNISDDAIHFFLNDSLYKNDLDIYRNASDNLGRHISSFNQNASNVYKTIAELTGYPKTLPDFIPHHLIEPTPQDLEAIIGNYKMVKFTTLTGEVRPLDEPCTIIAGKHSLELTFVNSNNTIFLYYKSNSELYDEEATSTLVKNDKNQVVKIISKLDDGEAEFLKIE